MFVRARIVFVCERAMCLCVCACCVVWLLVLAVFSVMWEWWRVRVCVRGEVLCVRVAVLRVRGGVLCVLCV